MTKKSNFILGSGLVGLLARHLLGPSYEIIPFKKSRYFSHDIPLADNEITYNKDFEEIFEQLYLPTSHSYYPIAVSYAGELIFNRRVWVETVVSKIYKDNPHPLAGKLLSAEYTAFNVSAKKLYDALLPTYAEEISKRLDSQVESIADNVIVIDGKPVEFNKIVNTIPLNALLKLMSKDYDLASSDYSVFLMATNAFDLEGARRCYIGDMSIPFWKVNVVGGNVFQFFANEHIESPHAIFELLTNDRFRVVAGTVIPEAFPLGAPPEALLDELEKKGIVCVGSNARWDYFYDISTCINKIRKI